MKPSPVGSAAAVTTPPAPSEPGPLSPLSNTAVSAAVVKRSAVAVALAGSEPRGLDSADVIVEEISNVPRWLAIYQSRDATVGPVSSTRPVDSVVLSVLHPVFAFNGGSRNPVERTMAAKLTPINAVHENSEFTVASGERAVNTASLRSHAKAPEAVPLLTFVGPNADPAPGMTPASHISVTAGSGFEQTWTYTKGKGWTSPDAGPALHPANLVFQYVEYKSLVLKHPDGGIVPSAKILGRGVALVATDGKVLDARWRKSGVDKLTTYATKHGILARFVPGQTLIVLVPTDSSVTTK